MFKCFNCSTWCLLVFQGKLFTGTLPETGRVLVLNTKDQDYRHIFIAAALYTQSDNIPACWGKREQLSIFLRALIFHSGTWVTEFQGILECCWCWSTGGIYFCKIISYLVMIPLACCWSHSFSKQVNDHMMPWNYFSSLRIAFLEGIPFGLFASFAQ